MRWIFRIFGALALMAVFAVGALTFMPTDRVAALAVQQIEGAIGRSLTVEGPVRPALWPELGVTTGPIALANADWSDAGPMIWADGLAIGVNTAALFGGALHVTRIEAINPVIQLERNAQGVGNWEITTASSAGPSETAASPAGAYDIFLERLAVSNGTLRFSDHATGQDVALTQVEAAAWLDTFDGPAALALSGVVNGQAITLEGDIGDLAGFLSAGLSTAAAKGSVGASNFAFDGQAGLTPFSLGGATQVDLRDADAIFALLGVPAPDLPQGFGRERIELQGELTYTPSGVTLREAALRLDDNLLIGDIDANLQGERPMIAARLSADMLDVSALAEDQGPQLDSAGSATAATAGWSTELIDVSGLQSVDADVLLHLQSIDLGLIELGETRTRTTLDRGRAVTEISEMAAYGGAIAGSFVVNSRGGLSARASFQAYDLELQALLADLAGYDRLIASGDVAVNLLGVGNSVDALMKSLEGDVSAQLGSGELVGLDLVGMLRNLDPSFVGAGQKTIFDGLSGSFAVDGGVARGNDLALDARMVSAGGAGTVDLGQQSLDYRLRATLSGDAPEDSLAVPIKISGSWAAPRIRLDLESLVKNGLAEEIEAVKAEGERAILQAIEEETGVKAKSLQEVEDVVKDTVEQVIENEVGNVLRGLFDQ